MAEEKPKCLSVSKFDQVMVLHGDGRHQPKKPLLEKSLSLIMLNDDCLLSICEYLNIFDLLRLSDVSTRLKHFMEDNVFPKYSRFDLDVVQPSCENTKLSLLHLFKLFSIIGPYIQSFHTSCRNIVTKHDYVLSFIYEYCTNLEEMHLEHMHISDINILCKRKRMTNSFSKLKVLNLNACSGLDDIFMRLLPNLTDLSLQHVHHFNGDGLLHLQKLEKLSIEYCGLLDPDMLLSCFELNTKLKELTLKECTQGLSNRERFQSAISNLKSLEYLSTNYLDGWPLDKLDGLKSLNALFEPWVPSLRPLAEKNQLEELDLSWCCSFEDNEHDFHKYLLNFSHLKVLNLNYLANVNEQLLLKMTAKLKLTHLGCASVDLSEEAIVKTVELSDCLEWFYCTGATVGAIQQINDLLSRQLYRPKLSLLVDIENAKMANLKIDNKRIQLLGALPNAEHCCEDWK